MRNLMLALFFFCASTLHAAPEVAIGPFEEIDANPSQGWIGQAIQQSLIADLSQVKTLHPRPADDKGADYVIRGHFQVNPPQLRITGQVIHSPDGRVLGGLKATGDLRDLFSLQDTVATQAKRILSEATNPPVAVTASPPPQPTVIQVHVPLPQVQPDTPYGGSGLQQAVQTGRIPNAGYRHDPRYSYPGFYDPRNINFTYGYPYFGTYGYYRGYWNWCGGWRVIGSW